MERYVAIRLRGADIDKGFYLRVTNETDRFLSGIEVNDKADEVMPRGKCTERLRVIDQSPEGSRPTLCSARPGSGSRSHLFHSCYIDHKETDHEPP